MSDDDTDRARPSSHFTGLAALSIALPLLYALSIGPVAYMLVKYPSLKPMEGAAATFYAPMLWSCHYTSFEQPLVNYVGWWERLARRR
ncbi:hypothetical protein [Prosthecobacter sp.]|uniref:hypothetical protein n=1 Tax=Prosthecobacter sp. TaxID=1965333 RepID=UPI0037852199